MVLPVCGLRPSRAALLVVENVPKPISETLSPCDNASVIASIVPFKALSASALVMSADIAIAAAAEHIAVAQQDAAAAADIAIAVADSTVAAVADCTHSAIRKEKHDGDH